MRKVIDRLTIPASTWYADRERRGADAWNRRTYKWASYAGNWGDPDKRDRTARPYYADRVHWRDCGPAHDIAPRSIRHTGWYGDEYGDNLCVGRVWQLPSRDGTPRYVPGYEWTEAEGITLFPLDVHDDKADAAASADWYAQRAAELEREYQAKERARMDVDEARDRIREARAQHRAIVRELRNVPADARRPVLCDAIRARLEDIRAEARDGIKTIRRTMSEYPGAFRDA